MNFKRVAASLAAVGLLISFPASAGNFSQAEKLRRLDIMLMVTGLRCRNTADNFTREYGRFTTAHLSELNAAAATLKQELTARHGAAGANKALDRLSVQMANTYGQGHPWLNCGQLKQVAGSLAVMRGGAALAEAANDLLEDRSHQLAWLR
ncbi:MAG: S-adenosyl-L-homocysteine hydrolase [Novosphingobium sp.]|uniref:S-adenosyl-L-homocysteine hydrolase n=1 Tax=Novosphingobium sp. TaxID=1874826 RepID=UPI0032BBA5AD